MFSFRYPVSHPKAGIFHARVSWVYILSDQILWLSSIFGTVNRGAVFVQVFIEVLGNANFVNFSLMVLLGMVCLALGHRSVHNPCACGFTKDV